MNTVMTNSFSKKLLKEDVKKIHTDAKQFGVSMDFEMKYLLANKPDDIESKIAGMRALIARMPEKSRLALSANFRLMMLLEVKAHYMRTIQ